MQLTQDQYTRLKPHEIHLERAYYGGYIYALTKAEYNEICTVYNEFFDKNESSKTACGTCRMRVCMLLGKYYFLYKENISKKRKKKNESKTK